MIRDSQGSPPLTFYFNGNPVAAQQGDSIAAALLSNGITTTRLTRNGTARGPYCMMGACYDCLVEINGVTVQSCMTTATEGLEVFTASPVQDNHTQSHTSHEHR